MTLLKRLFLSLAGLGTLTLILATARPWMPRP